MASTSGFSTVLFGFQLTFVGTQFPNSGLSTLIIVGIVVSAIGVVHGKLETETASRAVSR